MENAEKRKRNNSAKLLSKYFWTDKRRPPRRTRRRRGGGGDGGGGGGGMWIRNVRGVMTTILRIQAAASSDERISKRLLHCNKIKIECKQNRLVLQGNKWEETTSSDPKDALIVSFNFSALQYLATRHARTKGNGDCWRIARSLHLLHTHTIMCILCAADSGINTHSTDSHLVESLAWWKASHSHRYMTNTQPTIRHIPFTSMLCTNFTIVCMQACRMLCTSYVSSRLPRKKIYCK